jgi:hypothetical protein
MLHFGRIGKVTAPRRAGFTMQYIGLFFASASCDAFVAHRIRRASNSSRIEFGAHRIGRASNFEIAK